VQDCLPPQVSLCLSFNFVVCNPSRVGTRVQLADIFWKHLQLVVMASFIHCHAPLVSVKFEPVMHAFVRQCHSAQICMTLQLPALEAKLDISQHFLISLLSLTTRAGNANMNLEWRCHYHHGHIPAMVMWGKMHPCCRAAHSRHSCLQLPWKSGIELVHSKIPFRWSKMWCRFLA
jgi:hypothetical protein